MSLLCNPVCVSYFKTFYSKYQDEKFAEVIQSDIVESHIKEEEEKRELEAQDSVSKCFQVH